MKRSLIMMLVALNFWGGSFAEIYAASNLTLTDVEMQKLKNYFPDNNTQLRWHGDPISIHLPLGQEKRLIFPGPVTVDVKGALTVAQLRILNNDQSLYLTALTSFPVTRIYVTQKESGKVMLFDLDVSQDASNATQYINIKSDEKIANNALSETLTSPPQASFDTVGIDDPRRTSLDLGVVSYVDLIRFAYQANYAPDRLLKEVHPRVTIKTEKFVSDLVYGDKVIAHPVASWMVGNDYVTIVALQNKYPHQTHIDIRHDLCGNWQAATIYPQSTLKPQGARAGDSTTLFLVSQKSFSETLGVCHGDA